MEIQKKIMMYFYSLMMCLFLLTAQKATAAYILIQTGNNWATEYSSDQYGWHEGESSYLYGYDSYIDANCIWLTAVTNAWNDVISDQYEGMKAHGILTQAGAGVVNNWEWEGLGIPPGGWVSYFIGELLPPPYPGCGYDEGTYWLYATFGTTFGGGYIEVTADCNIPFAYSSSTRNCTMTHFVYNNDENYERYEEYGELGSTLNGYCRALHLGNELEADLNYNVYGDDASIISDDTYYYTNYYGDYDSAAYGAVYDTGLKFMITVTENVFIPDWTSTFEAGFSLNNYHSDLGMANAYHTDVYARALNKGLVWGNMNIVWDFTQKE